ncbi:NAD-dependent epimerase/dehydratase family protein [Flexivirga lutea]
MKKIGIVGASGFVGSAVTTALLGVGIQVHSIRAPRFSVTEERDISGAMRHMDQEIVALAAQFTGCDAVINCAGNPDASSQDEEALFGANALLPGVIGASACLAGIPRYVHVSSAVVQGRAEVLDSSMQFDPFSAYARSKMRGELHAREFGPVETSIYRPPSVHASSRRVTRGITRLAASPFSSVAAPAESPTPQTLVANVADALRFMATTEMTLPPVVHHPSEGLTTGLLLELLGSRKPKVLPRALARAAVGSIVLAGRAVKPLAPNARRVEMLWFGQRQATSWLDEQGWQPIEGLGAWMELGWTMRNRKEA